MNKFAVLALVIVGLSCCAEADSLSECREKVEKAVAEITIPQELLDAGELLELIAKDSALKDSEYKLARKYYENMDLRAQLQLADKSYDLKKGAFMKLKSVGCESGDINKLVNLSMDREWTSTASDGAISEFNRYHKLAQMVHLFRRWALSDHMRNSRLSSHY